MAKRAPVPPYRILPDDGVVTEPVIGWELSRAGESPQVISDQAMFPSWDSSLQFELKRRFIVDLEAILQALGLKQAQCRFRLITRLETGRGLQSILVDNHELIVDEETVEVLVKPDSSMLSRDLALVTSIALVEAEGVVDELAPTDPGSRLWQQRWSTRLEDGQARLPIEVVSFSREMRGAAAPRALIQVSVADYPDLEFDQAVCVYLNGDFPQFVSAIEKGEPGPTAMLWDAVMRQLIGYGMSSTFAEITEKLPEGSIGMQLRSWMQAVFPGEGPGAIAASRAENPGMYEAKIQSWTNSGSFWDRKY